MMNHLIIVAHMTNALDQSFFLGIVEHIQRQKLRGNENYLAILGVIYQHLFKSIQKNLINCCICQQKMLCLVSIYNLFLNILFSDFLREQNLDQREGTLNLLFKFHPLCISQKILRYSVNNFPIMQLLHIYNNIPSIYSFPSSHIFI